MLVAEQYLMIYLFSIFLLENKSVKVLSLFLCLDFIFESVLHSFLSYTPYEYLIIMVMVEVGSLLFILQFVKCHKLKNLFIICYIPTLISPLFLLTINHWIVRNDFISYAIFIICTDVTKYSNELFLTYLIYTNNDKKRKTNFWQTFVIFNYLFALIS